MKEILCTYSTSVLIIILKFNKSEKEALLSKEREREREREQLGFLALYHHKNIFFPTLKAPF
tara:strand:- start:5266 stop:5451 length:186 start_codon:yes stop_codon:yes gene_type:complete